ncbi:MAG: hypothetical protein ACJ8E7_00250 [Sphingomicrobium sp.]
MMKWMLAAGVAALAVTAPLAAGPGGKGGGQQAHAQKTDRGGKSQAQRGGGKQTAQVQRGGGKAQTAKSGGGHKSHAMAASTRGGGKAQSRQMQFAQTEKHGRGRDSARIEARGKDRERIDRVGAVHANNKGGGRDHVRTVNVDREAIRGNGKGRFAVVDGNDIVRVRDFDRGVVRMRDVDRDDLFVQRAGFGVGGCPPGLAKKAVPCMPPGQAAKLVGEPLAVASRFGALAPLPLSMQSLYMDDPNYYYQYGGGYMYRVDRGDNLIASMIPLFGAAMIGQPLQPNYLNNYYQPSYFNAFYPNSPYDCYRYGFGYVYETDCMTGLVEDVIPTYDNGYGIGQILPSSYSYYNVPYAYRSSFADNNDYYYRYAPGAIYQVDRGTSLISAVAALLTGGLTVGQPLPMGYSAYNVPLAYRSSYFDTPDTWYRYDNGYIYNVDPGSRMVRNVAYVVV